MNRAFISLDGGHTSEAEVRSIYGEVEIRRHLKTSAIFDTSINDVLRLSTILLLVPPILILLSYVKIIISIIRIHSGRYKVFSTCFSHLTVVVLFYGTVTFMYVRPRSSEADNTDKIMSVFCTIITPLLNPLIYSLRNKDVLRAMRARSTLKVIPYKYSTIIMQNMNRSTVTEFILLGLSSDPRIQVILIIILLAVYVASLAANCLLILAVSIDRRLHNPMYFFLINLSIINIGGPSVTVPKMLVNLLHKEKSILLQGCAAQIFFNLLLGGSECFLLVFMAYDRFIAICKPLRYHMVMSTSACKWMITITWTVSCALSLINVLLLYSLTFCAPNIINHFFCALPSLMLLSCSDTSILDPMMLGGSVIVLLVPVFLILFSYCRIIVSIMRIQSGRYKAFSTCISHLIVVTLFFVIDIAMFMSPKAAVDNNRDKIVSAVYILTIPILNPLIYSLRNKDVIGAMKMFGSWLR
ncbi:olfactory receptor 2B2-like [Pelobates cultripes]|uniref:Olfactory receptor 2B2-like n=1 Tax=Pelobates cultripes TaxID=61616 RepID=A0AAD1RBC8_PELCU|nr:olfactory receptor 2B2-like [Pelobates cultripes]